MSVDVLFTLESRLSSVFSTQNFSAWIDEKSLRPYAEFRDEMKPKGKPKDQFMAAVNDAESFIENPDLFSALFEKKIIPKKKASPKPKASQNLDFDFDSLKEESSTSSSSPSIPAKPLVATTPVAAPPKRSISSTVKSSEKPKIAEKTPKVPPNKRKATRESENDYEERSPVQPAPKKSRISHHNSIGTVSSSSDHVKSTEPVLASTAVFGFIGLGIMGSNIVKNILEAGHQCVIWNRTSEKCDEIVGCQEYMVTTASSPKEVFEQAQITFVCVSDADAVKETICDGMRGVLAADISSCDKGLVMLSSIDCETSKDISEAISLKGPVRYLEAQIQGSRNQAKSGSLIVIASGNQQLFDECKSCFNSFAKQSFYLGEDNEAAIKTNLVLQTVAGVQLAALSEAFALADNFDLQLNDILEIIGISNLNSEFIHEKGEVIIKGGTRDASMKVDTMQKDLKMAIDFGDCELDEYDYES